MGKARRIKVGDWGVTPSLNLIEAGGRSIKIEPKAMDVLVYLTAHAGEVVSVDELIGAAWPGQVVGDSSVYERIKQLRNAFGDDSRVPRYLETIPKRGYRLVASVEILPSRPPAPVFHRLLQRRWQRASATLLSVLLLLAISLSQTHDKRTRWAHRRFSEEPRHARL